MSLNYLSACSWSRSCTDGFLTLAPQLSPFEICTKAGACFLGEEVQRRFMPRFPAFWNQLQFKQLLSEIYSDQVYQLCFWIPSTICDTVHNSCESKKLNSSNRDPGIASVLEKHEDVSDGLGSDVTCTFCEMAVIWAQNQLRKNNTEAQIKAYMNQVTISSRNWEGFLFIFWLLWKCCLCSIFFWRSERYDLSCPFAILD